MSVLDNVSSIAPQITKIEDKNLVRVLLVEDNPINQKVATALLAKLNCQVDIANHGLEALARLNSRTYDLIFMDLHMPEMDGYIAASRIRDDMGPKAPPIVAMTAAVFQEDVEKCINVGMVDFIGKPLRLETLIFPRWANT